MNKIKTFFKTYKNEIVTGVEFTVYLVALGILVKSTYGIGYIDGGKDATIKFLTSCLEAQSENQG